MDITIVKREREANWSQEEKDIFRELISKHVGIIDDKRNDSKLITKKKGAWQNIKCDMEAAGYHRETPKLKQQWMRMKANAKNNLAAIRKARTATGNNVGIPKLDSYDAEVLDMIQVEVIEDIALIDSNSEPIAISQIQETPQPHVHEKQDRPEQSVEEQQREPHEKSKSQQRGQTLINKLHNLPKHNEKYSVLEERVQQIKKETKQSEEMHEGQMEKIRAEISYNAEIHLLNIQHLKELHELKKTLLINQIKNSSSGVLQ